LKNARLLEPFAMVWIDQGDEARPWPRLRLCAGEDEVRSVRRAPVPCFKGVSNMLDHA
jgi:hypothetical protein